MAPTILNALAAILLVSCTPLAAAAPKTLPISSRQTAGNCTSSSFTVPSWYIREFKTTSATDASFSLQNRATGSSTVLSCKAAGSEGALACTSSSGSDPSLQVALQVKDAKANIQVQQAWSCNDRDPSRPYVNPMSPLSGMRSPFGQTRIQGIRKVNCSPCVRWHSLQVFEPHRSHQGFASCAR